MSGLLMDFPLVWLLFSLHHRSISSETNSGRNQV